MQDANAKPRHFCILLVDGFSHLALACAIEPLRLANRISGKELYHFSLATENGHPARCLSGLEVAVHHGFCDLPACDRLFVLASEEMAERSSRMLLATLRRIRAMGTPIGALCSAAWILAEAGFLAGRPVALHWDYHDSFRERFPDLDLLGNVFVDDPKHMTAAGGTATADLMLHVIEQDHGAELAAAVADQMVYSAVRSDTAKQCMSLQSRVGRRNPHLLRAVTIMKDTLDEPSSPTDIARQLGISTRQLERLFAKFLNTTPKKYYTGLRLERAQKLLLQTEASVIEIAIACGFESSSHFARAYKARFGVTPSHQRHKIT